MLTRRTFLQTSLRASAALAASGAAAPKRIAIIATVYRLQSHAQHMGDRFLTGYPYGGAWHKPNMRVVSLYVDQTPEGDLSAARAREFGFQVYPTIAEALRCGGKQLAVDAVLLIAEHGDYPHNDKGQVLYPRYEKTAAPFLCTTISTCRIASKKPKPWWTPRAGYISRCWLVLRFQ
jgi:hypothetical protein